MKTRHASQFRNGLEAGRAYRQSYPDLSPEHSAERLWPWANQLTRRTHIGFVRGWWNEVLQEIKRKELVHNPNDSRCVYWQGDPGMFWSGEPPKLEICPLCDKRTLGL